MSRAIIPLGLFFLTTFTAGCGGGGVAPVSGTVLLKGKPLPGATVVFIPTETGKDRKVATAITGPDGAFHLNTHNGSKGGSGAIPGDYKVTVSKFVPPTGMSEAEFQKKAEAEASTHEKGVYNPDSSAPQKVESIAPEYSNGTKTKLTATVTPGGPNDFKFDIP